MKNKTAKKISLFLKAALLVFLLAFNAVPFRTNALSICFPLIGCSKPDSSEFYKEIENRYGFDQDIWRKAKRKVSAPRVEIFFNNTNPKPGEKVTAEAVPEFFKNDPQNLYYTWYIIHTKDGSIQTHTNSIDSGKREAAKIMARGDYDPDLDGQDYSGSGDPDKDGWPVTDNDNENDYAPMGGADGVGGLTASGTIHSSADSYCNSLAKNSDPSTDNCLFNDTASDKSTLDYYTLKSTQSDTYCSQCRDLFISENDADGDTVPDNPPPYFPEPADQSSRNLCCYNALPMSALPCDSDGDGINDSKCSYDSSVTNYCDRSCGSDTTCDNSKSACFDTFKTNNLNFVQNCIDGYVNECVNNYTSNNDEIIVSVSRCYKHLFSQPNTSFRTDDNSGLDFPIACKHKWPDAPGYESGSGHFKTGEEKYWKTDPVDPDTDGDGFVDEADVIGLGHKSFTWTYQAGDRVGVVVEGTSMLPTDEKNAYYKIMWGYPDICDSTKKDLIKGDQCDNSDDYGYGFLATRAPNEQGDEKLKVSLSFNPENPVADPSDENKDKNDGSLTSADRINVTSSLDNTNNNPNNLFYTWQISGGDPAKDDWNEIAINSENFETDSPSSGLGLTEFGFTPKKNALDASRGINYFKVTLTISKSSGEKTGRGRSSVIVPVNTSGLKIKLYKVEATALEGSTAPKYQASKGKEVCDDGLYATLCPAVQFQMLAATVSGGSKLGEAEYSWSLNGNPLFLPKNASLFDGWSDKTVFFPITKEDNGIEEISVTAVPKNRLEPVSGSRLVTVVHPAAFIKSGDESTAWPLSYYIDNEDKKLSSVEVKSPDAFEAVAYSTSTFFVDTVPSYLIADDPNTFINWKINGSSVYDNEFYTANPDMGIVKFENNDQTIRIPFNSDEGVSHNLGVELKKYWTDAEKNILFSAWGIAPENLEGGASSDVFMVYQYPEEESAGVKPRQILAAIGTNLPHHFAYVLRLALTILVMFFASSAIYGLTGKIGLYEEK
jgi:hypothetical protein